MRNEKIEMGFLSNFEETNQNEQQNEGELKEDASSALYHQPLLNIENKKVLFYLNEIFKEYHQKTVEIEKLRKNFGSVTAVEDLTLSLYESQLFWYIQVADLIKIKNFSLLGHNGAGKTTTINALTGMYKIDKGKIKC